MQSFANTENQCLGGKDVRHALITAGSKGLGRKVTEALLEKGYSVTVNYRQDEEAVSRLKEKWRSSLDRLQFVKGDVTKKEDLLRMVNAALERFGKIDLLINNAGPYIFERKSLQIILMMNGMTCLKAT